MTGMLQHEHSLLELIQVEEGQVKSAAGRVQQGYGDGAVIDLSAPARYKSPIEVIEPGTVFHPESKTNNPPGTREVQQLR